MLKVVDLSKTFNQGTVNERVAIDHVNLHLEKGDFVTIIGSNGAGKSTLFNLISGAYFPDEGRILLGDKELTFMKEYTRAREIGRLFQDPLKGTAPNMTIEENLALAYMRAGEKHFKIGINQKDRTFFKERLEPLGLGLENRMKTKVGLLSGGQRQAVTLMMSTLVTPKLLLLDEHTAALDPATAEKVLAITKEVVERNQITTMMITHNIQSALALGNRTFMMHEGRIVADLKGSIREEMTTEKLLQLFKEVSHKKLDTDRLLFA